jgi:hypothetical protein
MNQGIANDGLAAESIQTKVGKLLGVQSNAQRSLGETSDEEARRLTNLKHLHGDDLELAQPWDDL